MQQKKMTTPLRAVILTQVRMGLKLCGFLGQMSGMSLVYDLSQFTTNFTIIRFCKIFQLEMRLIRDPVSPDDG
jgi:hypothetical protein